MFLDPPYGRGLAEQALVSARAGGWLTRDALIVVEEAADAAFAAPDGFTEIERRRYDDTELVFLNSLRDDASVQCERCDIAPPTTLRDHLSRQPLRMRARWARCRGARNNVGEHSS